MVPGQDGGSIVLVAAVARRHGLELATTHLRGSMDLIALAPIQTKVHAQVVTREISILLIPVAKLCL